MSDYLDFCKFGRTEHLAKNSMIIKNKLYPILADAAYCFDFLSILDVKRIKNSDYDNHTNYITQIQLLEDFIGAGKLREILNSSEYNELYLVNLKLYELVDLSSRDEIRASQVNAANHRRFLAKREIQKRFFPEECQIEKKANHVN